MDAATDALRPALEDVCARLDVDADDAALERLLAYLALLRRWNAVYNLTAIREPAQMLTQHLADCIAVVPALRRTCRPGAGTSLLDVGSGGGLPGVVIAILMADAEVTCIDTVGKKVAFVQQVAAELGLRNLHARHGRVEALELGRFDVVVARAFASLADFVRLTERHLAPDGVWLAMKGKRADDEIAALPDGVVLFHVEPLQIPGLDAERRLMWLRRSR